MIQPGKRLTGPEIEDFLSQQNLTTQYVFDILKPTGAVSEKILKNDKESFIFLSEQSNQIYEYKYSMDVV